MTGITDLPSLIAAILIFLAIPGPGTIKLLATFGERNGGVRAGVWSTFGLICGDFVWMVLALSGVAALAAANPRAFDLMRYAGALYLAWIGWQLVRTPGATATLPERADEATATRVHARGARHWFRESMFVSLSNPKVIGFYVAFFPLFIDRATFDGVPTYARMIGTVVVLAFLYCMFLLTVAKFARRTFRAQPMLGVWLKRAAGVALLGFSVKFALQASEK